MPIWLIEIMAARQLDGVFLFIVFMTTPVWLAMMFFPGAKVVQKLAHPLMLPPLYSLVLFMILWKFYDSWSLSKEVDEVSYNAAKALVRHPATLLALMCNFQIINLALGTFIFQKARRNGFKAPLELAVCGLLGAPALIPFVIRLLLKDKSLS